MPLPGPKVLLIKAAARIACIHIWAICLLFLDVTFEHIIGRHHHHGGLGLKLRELLRPLAHHMVSRGEIGLHTLIRDREDALAAIFKARDAVVLKVFEQRVQVLGQRVALAIPRAHQREAVLLGALIARASALSREHPVSTDVKLITKPREQPGLEGGVPFLQLREGALCNPQALRHDSL